MDEAARMFLEDWFSAHPEQADAFPGEALDILGEIVGAAQAAAREEKAEAVDAAAGDRRVTSLLSRFLGGAEVRLRKKAQDYVRTTGKNVPKGGDPTGFDSTKVSDEDLAKLRGLVAAGLRIEDRREAKRRDLTRDAVSVSSLARELGMDRSSLSYTRFALGSCLVDFLVEHAGAVEERQPGAQADPALKEELAKARAEIAALRRQGVVQDAWEVKCHRKDAELAQMERDVRHQQHMYRFVASRYVTLKTAAEAKGVDVPLAIDEMERIEDAAKLFEAMQPTNKTAS